MDKGESLSYPRTCDAEEYGQEAELKQGEASHQQVKVASSVGHWEEKVLGLSLFQKGRT